MTPEDAMSTLDEIRDQADDCAELESKYIFAKERAKVAKEAWEAAQARLAELCRSHRTSEEVAARPLIKAVEQAAESNGQPLADVEANHEEDEPAHHGEPVESWEEAKDRRDEADALEMIETANETAKPKSRKRSKVK